MKKLLTSVLLLVLAVSTWAVDIIVKMDETRIDAIIVEVSETTIKYRKASNPNGPLFVIKVEDIASIIYANGDVQAYNTAPSPSTSAQSQQTEQVQPANQPLTAYDAYWLYKLEEEKKAKEQQARLDSLRAVEQEKKDSIWAIKVMEMKQRLKNIVFQAHLEFAGMVGREPESLCTLGGIGFDGIFGFRSPKQYNYLGIGLGFHGSFDNYYYDDYYSDKRCSGKLCYMPIYVNDRIYIPTHIDIKPFADLSLGGFAILGGRSNVCSYPLVVGVGGILFRIGAGIDWRRLNFGMGYQLLATIPTDGYNFHEVYFKVGYRFGKNSKEDKRMY